MAKRGECLPSMPSRAYTAEKLADLRHPARDDKNNYWVDQYGPRAPVEPWKHVSGKHYPKRLWSLADLGSSQSNVIPLIPPLSDAKIRFAMASWPLA